MNKPTNVFAALCLLNSASVYALGVGEIETHSALNQVLRAKIPLVSSKNEDPSNVIISIASREIFRKAGIDRPHYLTQLMFTPILGENGEITINVTSNTTIKEPFVNFILEVEWPQGRTLKEFTILLDPPITMSDVRTTPIELPKTPVITQNTAVTTSKTAVRVTTASDNIAAQQYGPTKSRDNIWGIAKTLVKSTPNATHYQMMLALYDNNPKAFYKKNINALKKGVILQTPSQNQLANRSVIEAKDDFNKQNALWSTSSKAKPTLVANVINKAQQAITTDVTKKKPEHNADNAKLTLLTPKHEIIDDVTVEGNSTDTPIGSSNPNEQASMAIEMVATLEEENKEVKSRLDDLETQVDKLKRLIALKDKRLAQLQSVKPAASKPAEKAALDDGESNLPLYGGGLVLALLGLFLARRNKKNNADDSELDFTQTSQAIPPTNIKPSPINTQTEDSDVEITVIEEAPLLSEFTPSEFDANAQTQEADPLTESDVYIAYGRYQQAEDLIQKALATEPNNLDYKLKLLDIYFASTNASSFQEFAKTLVSLKESDASTWSSIEEMGKELCPQSSLFLSAAKEDVTSEISLESNEENLLAQDATDSNSTSVDDFEFDFDLIKNEPLDEISDTATIATATDSDENAIETKLALAQASIDMEDIASANEALNEVLATGSKEQKAAAQSMLDNL